MSIFVICLYVSSCFPPCYTYAGKLLAKLGWGGGVMGHAAKVHILSNSYKSASWTISPLWPITRYPSLLLSLTMSRWAVSGVCLTFDYTSCLWIIRRGGQWLISFLLLLPLAFFLSPRTYFLSSSRTKESPWSSTFTTTKGMRSSKASRVDVTGKER